MQFNPRHRSRPTPVPSTGHNGFIPKHSPRVSMMPIDGIKNSRRNIKNPKPELVQLHCANMRTSDLILPLLVDRESNLIHGVEIYLAAKELGVPEVPVIVIDHMSEAEIRSYRTFLAKSAELSIWDFDAVRLDFEFMLESGEDLDLGLTGFKLPEIDNLFLVASDAADEEIPEIEHASVATRRGDTWLFEGGRHRIRCGSALEEDDYVALMQGERAQMVVGDPPYGVPIAGHVSGLGKKKHSEFVMGSKGMSREELEAFLRKSFELMKLHSAAGAIHAIWMDWRGIQQILAAADGIYDKTLNMCVWDKQSGAMGSLYRSQHELCFIFKATEGSHTNNVQLGRHGRTRTNVWSYPGLSQLGPGRQEALKSHPTVKPVGLIYEIILDVSVRDGIVLDPYLGSGTTIIASHRAGRRGFGMDLDPGYVDVAVRRVVERTGMRAVLAETGESFDEVAARRTGETKPSEASHV